MSDTAGPLRRSSACLRTAAKTLGIAEREAMFTMLVGMALVHSEKTR